MNVCFLFQSQLEDELDSLKTALETDDKQNGEQMVNGEIQMQDAKDELMDYFIDKFRPKNFDLVAKIYKDNQVIFFIRIALIYLLQG